MVLAGSVGMRVCPSATTNNVLWKIPRIYLVKECVPPEKLPANVVVEQREVFSSSTAKPKLYVRSSLHFDLFSPLSV